MAKRLLRTSAVPVPDKLTLPCVLLRPIAKREIVEAGHHASSILRAPDDESRHKEMRKVVDDLKEVAAQLQHLTT